VIFAKFADQLALCSDGYLVKLVIIYSFISFIKKFESEAPAEEEILDCVVYRRFSFQMCLEICDG